MSPLPPQKKSKSAQKKDQNRKESKVKNSNKKIGGVAVCKGLGFVRKNPSYDKNFYISVTKLEDRGNR